MLSRRSVSSELFPHQCEVRGCSQPPSEWFNAGDVTAQVCGDHELELRAGEPYALERGEMLVGRDCTEEILGVGVARTTTSETAVVRLGRDGVTHQEVRLDSLDDLCTALRVLGDRAADRHQGRGREDSGR